MINVEHLKKIKSQVNDFNFNKEATNALLKRIDDLIENPISIEELKNQIDTIENELEWFINMTILIKLKEFI